MGEAVFYLNNQTQRISIDPNEISGVGSDSNPAIQVPAKFHLSPTVNDNGKLYYILLGIETNLRVNGFNSKISSASQLLNYKIDGAGTWSIYFELPLDHVKLSAIEKKRIDNLTISLNFTMQFAICESLPIMIGNKMTNHRLITDISQQDANMTLEIKQSHWVSKVLPSLGYDCIKIIEIPTASELLSEELPVSLKELQIANQHFLSGNYDDTVGYCRKAIEPIKKKLPDLKKQIESDSEKDWLAKVTEATDTWLDIVMKQTYALTSKAHHPPSIGHFSRHEAEIIYMITTGIIAYAGKFNLEKYSQRK